MVENSCHRVELLRVKTLGRNYSVVVPVTVELDMSVLKCQELTVLA